MGWGDPLRGSFRHPAGFALVNSGASVHDDPCGTALRVCPVSLVGSDLPEDPPSPRWYGVALEPPPALRSGYGRCE